MAIENALIAKIVGGVSVIGGASGGIYAYKDAIIDSLFGSDETYLVVKSDASTTVDTNLSELYVKNDAKKTINKNFKCKFTNDSKKEEIDDTCDIFSFKDKNTENKLIDLQGVDKSKTKTVKSEITANKFFTLRVKKNIFSIKKFDGTEKISLISTENGKTGNYSEFSVLYKIEGNKVVSGKTNLIIGKATNKTSETITTTAGATCSLKGVDKDVKKDCSIYKFTAQPPSKKHTDLVFDSTNPASNTENDLTNDHLYLIDLKDKKVDVSSLISKTVMVYESKDSGEKRIIDFEFISALATNENSFNSTTTKTFFLN